MKLLVLAGGYGTRLKSTVEDVPKPLAPVLGVPFLKLQLELWVSQGLNEFIFLLHHQADQIIDFLKSQLSHDYRQCRFDWLVEDHPLGTGGAIANAVRCFSLKNDFLIANADTWLGGGMDQLKIARTPAMAVVKRDNIDRYGRVLINENSFIVKFKEKEKSSRSGWVNAGVSKLSPKLFKSWDGSPFSIEKNLFEDLSNKHILSAIKISCDFMDIGIPEDYIKFCNWIKEGKIEKL